MILLLFGESNMSVVEFYVLTEPLYWMAEAHSDSHYLLHTKEEIKKMFGVSEFKKGTLLCRMIDDDYFKDDALYMYDPFNNSIQEDYCIGWEFCNENNILTKLPYYMCSGILNKAHVMHELTAKEQHFFNWLKVKNNLDMTKLHIFSGKIYESTWIILRKARLFMYQLDMGQ